jgi:hypothetical protein
MKLSFLQKINWVLVTQLGFNWRRCVASISGLPKFIRDYFIFLREFRVPYSLQPCLSDHVEGAGGGYGEYFWQDLYVSQEIFINKPFRHLDIGSRLDGFVAHVASFREIDVIDIRKIDSKIPSVFFSQIDISDSKEMEQFSSAHKWDSISCLHVLEHIGLGRYGDKINPLGYKNALKNIANLLSVGGVLYLSTPIGSEKIMFNANWIFDARTLLDLLELHGLKCFEVLKVVDNNSPIKVEFSVNTTFSEGLHIFIFKKEYSEKN